MKDNRKGCDPSQNLDSEKLTTGDWFLTYQKVSYSSAAYVFELGPRGRYFPMLLAFALSADAVKQQNTIKSEWWARAI